MTTMPSRTQIRLAVLVATVTSCVALTTSYTASYQPSGHFHPYDRYESGFLADPNGYESRNTYQRSDPISDSTSYSPSNVGAVLSKVTDKRRDVIGSDYTNDNGYTSKKKANVDDLGVVYRKHLKEDYIRGNSGSHGNARRGPDDSEYGYTGYYGNSARHGDNDYATRNAGLSRYNTINTGGWVSASTRHYDNAPLRSGYRYEYDQYDGGVGHDEVELIDTPSSGSHHSRYPGGREAKSVAVKEYALEPSQTPGGGYGSSLRPWYLRRLDGKEAITLDDYEMAASRDSRNNMVQKIMQPVVLDLVTSYDPCIDMPDGDYPLTSSFEAMFPYVDQQCNFVKCAHRAAFLNPCGIGTRNPLQAEYNALDDSSARYCSMADTAGLCRALTIEKDTQVDDLVSPSGGHHSSMTESQVLYSIR